MLILSMYLYSLTRVTILKSRYLHYLNVTRGRRFYTPVLEQWTSVWSTALITVIKYASQ